MASTAKLAMAGLTFGCDPELFVMNNDNEFVSAEGLIPGTKDEPYPVKYGAVQVDGMAAEFNIDPVTTFEEFSRNVHEVQKQLKSMLPKGYKLVPAASVEFSEKVWEESPDHAKALGCSPDFNAWTGTVNPPPAYPAKERLRTASGHLHIGWTEDADPSDVQYAMACTDLVKQLDWYLGAWSTIHDKDTERRKLYGKAGAMRFKPYGVEYRVLSNFWLTSGVRRRYVWDRMQNAIWNMRNSFMPDKYASFNEYVIESIDKTNLSPYLKESFVIFKQN